MLILKVCLLATQSSGFHLSENILISSSFLKDSCTRYRIQQFMVLFFQHLKNVMSLPPGLCDFRWDICCQLNWYSVSNAFFLFGYFQDFFLSLVFGNSIMMCLRVDFFEFILFTQLLGSIVYILPNLGEFSSNTPCFHLYFWDFSDMNVVSLVIVPQIPET